MSEYLEYKDEVWDYHQILQQIKDNLNGREIVLRWKAPAFEKRLYEQLKIKASFYVTRDQRRINATDSFSDTQILDKANKYLLVIGEDLRWNQADSDRYLRGGIEKTEMCFG